MGRENPYHHSWFQYSLWSGNIRVAGAHLTVESKFFLVIARRRYFTDVPVVCMWGGSGWDSAFEHVWMGEG